MQTKEMKKNHPAPGYAEKKVLTSGYAKKKALALGLATAMLLGAGACGTASSTGDATRKDAESIVADNQATSTSAASDSMTDSTAASSDSTSASSSSMQSTKTEYPLTITTYGYDGAEVTTTYTQAPEKVLAVYQGSIETLLSLGLEDHMVACAGLDNAVPDDLKSAFQKVKYLDEFTPSKETVTMLEPDMILSWGSLFSDKNLGAVTDWISKDVNTYINTNTRPGQGDVSYARTLEHEYTDIENLGKIFDVQDKAASIVDDMKAVITQTKERVEESRTESPSALIIESMDNAFTNYGADTLGGDMLTQLGGTLANPGGADMGKEDIIAANPDVIFVVYMPYEGDDPETLKAEKLAEITEDASFASLDAVKNGRVVPIMLSEMYASATRTKDGIVTIAKGLYPDLALESK